MKRTPLDNLYLLADDEKELLRLTYGSDKPIPDAGAGMFAHRLHHSRLLFKTYYWRAAIERILPDFLRPARPQMIKMVRGKDRPHDRPMAMNLKEEFELIGQRFLAGLDQGETDAEEAELRTHSSQDQTGGGPGEGPEAEGDGGEEDR